MAPLIHRATPENMNESGLWTVRVSVVDRVVLFGKLTRDKDVRF
jgi:hypothetical protein